MRVYGPVPSRRFGLSLGVDLLPGKTCSFDCIYCQVGEEPKTTARLCDFFTVEEIIADIKDALSQGPRPDVITMAGSGEPTLYKSLPLLMEKLKQFEIPILLITNSSLLHIESVRKASLMSDIFAPSVDAGDASTFNRINNPHSSISFAQMVEALAETTRLHQGKVCIEVMLIKDINDDDESIYKIKNILDRCKYDQIDLNTPVRPPIPERGALPCDADTLQRAQAILGEKAMPIAEFKQPRQVNQHHVFDDIDKNIKETLQRRPCTAYDLANSHQIDVSKVQVALGRLINAGFVERMENDATPDVYYKAVYKKTIVGQR